MNDTRVARAGLAPWHPWLVGPLMLVWNAVSCDNYVMTFASIAVALALIGIFGVVSHLVSQRTVEIGIRMAMGAQNREILALVLRQGVVMIIVGLVLGTGGALAVTRLVGSLLYGVTTTDPLSFAAALLVLTMVGLLACYFPVRHALRIDPVIARRHDGKNLPA